ncbi:lysylphosphatidylglycerol synthase transmembrane domain-containing protein [Lactobacillus sp. Sy-1]|uniref:lysylphosphatidylglycerol synthase transmembrane domain-containing protein n=1 Tax=Lactobacillus sp. Sy-1 TaxID=2109645 RepID=UPI001C58F7A6|nr:lysylphosphatidylglycerol synthase transmembrane domain-containing protein [Lactobacillus sp. Sy-1]MBW1605394.1 flippase-like domain-containing protein [Lactobacillus sp. Sy-1]
MTKRNLLSLLGMFLIGFIIFWYFIRDVNLNLLVADFFNINWSWMLVATFCMFAYFGLESWITHALVKDQGENHFTFKDAIRVPLVEQLFNGITPFSSGGQPAQLVVMLQTGVDGGRASSVLLMKFVVYQAMIVINFLFSLFIGFHYISEKLHYLSLFVLFGFIIHLVVIIILLMIMYWHGFTKRFVHAIMKPLKFFVSAERYEKWQVTLNEKIDNFYNESVRIAHHWKLLFKVAVITFFQLLLYYLVPYFIMLALGYDQANIVMIVSLHVLIVMIISLFPIPGGAGGAEYSFEMLFKSYIFNSSKLVLALILWRILTYYLGLVLGAIALFIKPDRVDSDVKRNI